MILRMGFRSRVVPMVQGRTGVHRADTSRQIFLEHDPDPRVVPVFGKDRAQWGLDQNAMTIRKKVITFAGVNGPATVGKLTL
jgi:hypothetical protein